MNLFFPPFSSPCVYIYLAGESSSGDSDAETDRQAAAREMVRSQENPDQRYQSPTRMEGGRRAEERGGRRQPPQNEEEEEDEERKGTDNSQAAKSHVHCTHVCKAVVRSGLVSSTDPTLLRGETVW